MGLREGLGDGGRACRRMRKPRQWFLPGVAVFLSTGLLVCKPGDSSVFSTCRLQSMLRTLGADAHWPCFAYRHFVLINNEGIRLSR